LYMPGAELTIAPPPPSNVQAPMPICTHSGSRYHVRPLPRPRRAAHCRSPIRSWERFRTASCRRRHPQPGTWCPTPYRQGRSCCFLAPAHSTPAATRRGTGCPARHATVVFDCRPLDRAGTTGAIQCAKRVELVVPKVHRHRDVG
jgi:hypothetical protein